MAIGTPGTQKIVNDSALLGKAFDQTLNGTASTYTKGTYSKAPELAVYFIVTHSDRYGGDIGTPNKRSILEAEVKDLVPADPKTQRVRRSSCEP